MDYSGKYKTGGANFKPGRGLSVSQIMGQREGGVAARYADGTPVPRGMPINVAGWNTSGVGPGTRGYRGSGGIQGYSFENQGNAASKRGASNYSPYFGGLNEFYQNQQGLPQFDQLQNQQGMDQRDAFGSRLAQMSAFAAGRGDMDTAAAYAQALQDRAAQQMAAQGGGFGFPQDEMPGDPWSGVTSYGGMAPNVDVDPNSELAQSMLDQAALADRSRTGMTAVDVGRFQTPYGTASIGPSSAQSTFTNAQGSIGPGSVRTNYGGVQSGPAFFGMAADRTQEPNKFAAPTDYNQPPTGMSLGDYSRRLMEVKNKLGSK